MLCDPGYWGGWLGGSAPWAVSAPQWWPARGRNFPSAEAQPAATWSQHQRPRRDSTIKPQLESIENTSRDEKIDSLESANRGEGEEQDSRSYLRLALLAVQAPGRAMVCGKSKEAANASLRGHFKPWPTRAIP